MNQSLAVAMLTALWVSGAFGQDPAASKALELPDAVRQALERNPQLRAAQFGVQAAAGRRLQAGAIPNPTLSAEVENFGGSGESQGFDQSETTVALEQTFELGGKRAARLDAANGETRLAERDRDALRLDVIRQTTERFVGVWVAQEELTLSQEARQTAESIHRAFSNRVTAGKDGIDGQR